MDIVLENLTGGIILSLVSSPSEVTELGMHNNIGVLIVSAEGSFKRT